MRRAVLRVPGRSDSRGRLEEGLSPDGFMEELLCPKVPQPHSGEATKLGFELRPQMGPPDRPRYGRRLSSGISSADESSSNV